MAWDEIKYTTDNLTAQEWNDHIDDQKHRSKVEYGDGAPTSTPSMIGSIYIDTANNKQYVAVGTSNSSDWKEVTNKDDFNSHTSDSSIHFTQSAINIAHSQISDWDTQFSTDFDSSLSNKSTDDLSEGTTNLYYTDTRVSNNSDVSANTAHRANTSNPHSVTKTQVGLGNVPNVDATDPSNISQDTTHRFVTDTQISTWDGKQDSLGYTPENIANKGQNNGYASLDANGKIPTTQLPALAITDVNVVSTIAERDDLTVQEGDIAIVTSENKNYVYDGSTWQELLVPPDAVTSVNGETGAVSLNTDDISEGSTNKYYSSSLFNSDFSSKTTDNLSQGSTNKYYSSTLFNSDFNNKTTDDLSEGTTHKYDKTVSLTAGSDITISGTYPSFTIGVTDGSFAPSSHTHTISQISDIGNASVSHATTANSATSASDADKLDGLDSSQFLRSDADDSASGNVTFTKSISHTEGELSHIIHPSGAYYKGSGSETGAIQIQLPMYKSSTMIKMVIDVYDYDGSSNGESFTLLVGGYNYSNGNWYNYFAQLISGRSDKNFSVRFGEVNNKSCIWLGETSSTWNDLQIIVRDVFLGWSNYAASSWNQGWNISVVSSFGSVKNTTTATLDARTLNGHTSSYFLPASGTATNSDKVDGYDASAFAKLSGSNTFDGDVTIKYQHRLIFPGSDGAGNAGLRCNGENLEIIEPEEGNKVWAYFQDDTGLHLTGTPNLYATGSISGKTVYFTSEHNNGNCSGNITVNWTNGQKQKMTLTGNVSLSFGNPTGPCNVLLKIIQDSTGGRAITLPSNVKLEHGAVVDTSSDPGNSIRFLSLYFDGSTYYGQISDYYA